MESTPGFDNEHGSSSSPVHQGASEAHMMSSSSSGGQQSGMSGQGNSAQKYANGTHIRSRITVVCAECKRLKLKCDRRTPCSSCLKRDTVQRCVYSQAAAEKIDVQSLHNRLLVVEGTLAQLTSSPSTPHTSVPQFKSSFPAGSTQSNHAGPSSLVHHVPAVHSLPSNRNSVLAGLPCNDRSLLVTGSSGSSVVINLDDTASIWLNELESNQSSDTTNAQSSSTSPYTGRSISNGIVAVKLEPAPVILPLFPSTTATSSSTSTGLSNTPVNPSGYIPPVPYTVFLPASSRSNSSSAYGPPTATSQTYTSTFSSVPEYSPLQSSRQSLPQVTSALLNYLPATPAIRSRYLKILTGALMLHPCINMRHFESRIDAMFTWNENGVDSKSKAELAREVFGIAGSGKKTNGVGKDRGATSPRPTLSFFAAASAAFALGALMTKDEGDLAPPSTADGEVVARNSPAELFALSDQALSVFEKTSSYDVDSVVAMLLQVLYLLHDGQMRVAQAVFPLMGKLVNVSRMMGLAIDPDEFPGTYSLFDAEMRRRVWWDVLYYDALVSECMGQQALITDNCFTTRLPAEVDETKFTPSSTTPPLPVPDEVDGSLSFFVLRCRLAQLIKSMQKQIMRDPLAEESQDISVDTAAAGENEVNNWLDELPPAYKLSTDLDVTQPFAANPSLSPNLLGQRCVVAIVTNRLILKLYLPFLKEGSGSAPSKPSHQTVLGTINAAHSIIYASRLMHSIWRESRPATFDFYDFGRTLFDAAIVCAHTVIQQPTGVLAPEAMKCVTSALEVMRAMTAAKSRPDTGEAIKIVEMMKEKAEQARSLGSSESSAAGSKRKREGDNLITTLTAGFQLPFVGPSVSSARPEQPRPPISMSKIAASGLKKDESRSSKTPKDKGKEKDKLPRYPPVGIRVRSGSGQAPSVRQRTNSIAPSPSPMTPAGGRMLAPPTTGVGPPMSSHSHTSPSSDRPTPSSTSTPITDPHASSGYTFSNQPPPQSQQHVMSQEPMQQEYVDYSAGSSDEMGMDNRRYSHSYSNTPQSASTIYDQRTSQSPYATSPHTNSGNYRTGLPPTEYYLPSYPTVPSSGYEQSGLSQVQNLPMPPYSIDTSMAGGISSSIPGTPREQSYMVPTEKSGPSYDHQVGKSELERQMNHQYQPTAAAHGLPMTATQMSVQGWPQSEMRANTWQSDYKYYTT